MKQSKYLPLAAILFLFSCAFFSNKPKPDQLKSCLADYYSNRIVIESLEERDGVIKEKDGVKYYDSYINADIKFTSETKGFSAGKRYKIVKGHIAFIKTDKGWNCQEVNIGDEEMIEIKGSTGENDGGSDKNNRTNDKPRKRTAQSDFYEGRFPQASSRLLNQQEVSRYSQYDLKIMRNEIFARHGYIFQTDEMRSYFLDQPWYDPKYLNVDQMLTDTERKNISLIKSYEY